MNIVEILFSFLEGAAVIFSPCILPVLPLVLSTSISGGYRRPFGIISGFILAFTGFAFLSRLIVAVLHINLDYIKYVSLILLCIFGISLLSEKLLQVFAKFTNNLASLGVNLSSGTKDGYFSGVLIGALIGLIWTPCAGPILAAALVQIIRQQSNFNAFLLILAFAIGASVPMLMISILGRTIITKLSFFTKHDRLFHKTIGIMVLLSVGFVMWGEKVITSSSAQNKIANISDKVDNALANPYKAPDFAKSDIWLNTQKPITIGSLRNKVVLVDFWTYSCINCIRTIPILNKWYDKYQAHGLVIIGVHAPEFEFEKNKNNVLDAIARFKIKYPVALDNNLDTWSNYKNQYWPAHYLIDKNGNVVYVNFGEGNDDITEKKIQELLNFKSPIITDNSIIFIPDQTPETYLGYGRANSFVNGELNVEDNTAYFTIPQVIANNQWALSGKWLIEQQRVISKSSHAKLAINFTARHVYLVLGNNDTKPIIISLKLNGKDIGIYGGKDVKNSILTVTNYRLYDLVDLGKFGNGVLELDISNPNLEAYAFTFGS